MATTLSATPGAHDSESFAEHAVNGDGLFHDFDYFHDQPGERNRIDDDAGGDFRHSELGVGCGCGRGVPPFDDGDEEVAMAADAGRMIVFLGVAGVGGYTIWKYTEYQHALNIFNARDTSGATSNAVEQALPFMSYLMAGFSAPTTGTPAGNAYLLIGQALSGQLTTTSQTPGTSATTGQPSTTSVSTTPTTTTTVSASTSPSTTSSTTTTASVASTPQPTAQDLQTALSTNLASPDQWNYAYRELTGYGIEQLHGGNFDAIYGPIQSNGQRPTGSITAQAFLSLPAAKGLSGFGAIARFYTPVLNPMGSMVYRAQHPSPYRLPVSGGMTGLGALTQATGFEKALWAGGFIRSRRIR